MPKYLWIGNYQPEGLRGVLKEGGTSRRAAVEKLVESIGGRLESFYFAFGEDDAFVIFDAPSNQAAAAGALAVSATGVTSTRTVVLMTPEEMDEATKLSPQYRPPGA